MQMYPRVNRPPPLLCQCLSFCPLSVIGKLSLYSEHQRKLESDAIQGYRVKIKKTKQKQKHLISKLCSDLSLDIYGPVKPRTSRRELSLPRKCSSPIGAEESTNFVDFGILKWFSSYIFRVHAKKSVKLRNCYSQREPRETHIMSLLGREK